MDSCVAVIVKETGERGCIIRRLDVQIYEIWLEDGSVKTFSPDEFHEIERKEK